MTSKELREIARVTLAKELAADKVDMDRVNAAGMTLNLPNDPDEEREAQRLMWEAQSKQQAKNPIGAIVGSAGNMGKQFGA